MMGWEEDEMMSALDKQMWFQRENREDEEDLLDVENVFNNYDDFPSLPDFPCISSSSSSSCASAPVMPCSKNSSKSGSSSSTASSSSVTSMVNRKNKGALMSTASGSSIDYVGRLGSDDYMDVMQELGGMDLLDTEEVWDPSSLFPCHGIDDKNFIKQNGEEDEEMAVNQEQAETQTASEDLGNMFFEWLKTNKESISAEDLRNIKLKKSTIECAAKRLGGGKEGMKQLLKLILEWVQNYQLQKKRLKEGGESSSLVPTQVLPPGPSTIPNPNPSSDPNLNTNPYLVPTPMPPQWVPPQQPTYIPDSSTTIYPPMMYPYMGEPVYNTGTWGSPSNPYVPGTALPPGYPAFPDQSIGATPPPPSQIVPPLQPQPFNVPFVNPYSCQLYQNPSDRSVRLGSSATKEARKKRMARQKRFFSHSRSHSHHSQQNMDTRLGQDTKCTTTTQHPNWLYWPSNPSSSVSPSTMLVPDQPAPPPPPQVNQQIMQQPQFQHQASFDRRQGCKTGVEKNLKFLLQKVLKQSDVGSLGRIVLPKKEAETYLPGLEARDGISIAMEDIGSQRIWNMRYRFWPNNKSRMYLLENTGEFVRSNGLQEGDFIVIYSDVKCGKYLIRGVKVRQPGSKPEPKKQVKTPRTLHANYSSAMASTSTPTKEAVR
ncbi:acetolactate synthase [Ranunculus cassubicifolius]